MMMAPQLQHASYLVFPTLLLTLSAQPAGAYMQGTLSTFRDISLRFKLQNRPILK